MTLPADWLWVVVAAVSSWVAAKVWPVLAGALTARVAVDTDIRRATAEATLARSEREVASEEARTTVDRLQAEAIIKLGDRLEVLSSEQRQLASSIGGLSTAFSLQIGQAPTARDVQDVVAQLSAINVRLSTMETRLAMADPAVFGRRREDTDAHV